MKQDDEYIVMKLLNSNKDYKMILFSNNDKLLKDQKTSLSVIINKFYFEIQLMKKKYSLELWNTVDKNILKTL